MGQDLIPSAIALPTATTYHVMIRKVEALAHPIPITSDLHQASNKRPDVALLSPLVIALLPSIPIVSANWSGASN